MHARVQSRAVLDGSLETSVAHLAHARVDKSFLQFRRADFAISFGNLRAQVTRA